MKLHTKLSNDERCERVEDHAIREGKKKVAHGFTRLMGVIDV